MVFITSGVTWYIAELIMEITVANDPRNVVHKNFVLVRADSPEEAYSKAITLGNEEEDFYYNPSGHAVRICFRGLGYLEVIHDTLGHGAELMYDEEVGVPEELIRAWLVPKEQLPIFNDASGKDRPDYSAKEVVEEAEKKLKKKHDF